MSEHGQRTAYKLAIVSDTRMLVDYIAGHAARCLTDLQITDPRQPGAVLGTGQVLLRIEAVEQKLLDPPGENICQDDLAFIQLVRDALGRLVRPASGLTVAYTALVTGSRRGKHAESRAGLAQHAYPGLVWAAYVQRWTHRLLLALALLVTVAAVWESAKVALGRSLLQNLEGLRVQQAGIYAEKAKLEVTLDKPGDGSGNPLRLVDDTGRVALSAFALCDRRFVLADYVGAVVAKDRIPLDALREPLRMYGSPMERDVCERDSVLAVNFGIVHDDLWRYEQDWPAMVGSVFQRLDRLFGTSRGPNGLNAKQDDVEFVIAPILLVWGNYVLPIIFSFLGASIFVILDFYGKIRDSILDPRDNFLCLVRLVLGLVTGACIGLFVSSYSPVPPAGGAAQAASLISSLTLSASGVAFLAGFGVEGVFSMLEALVSRVFAVPQQSR